LITRPGAVQVQTTDPDLGLTIALWIDHLLTAFLAANPSASIVIDDGGRAGRPFRQGLLNRGPDFRVWRDPSDVVHVQCSSSSVVLAARPTAEAVRKLLVIMGALHDPVPLDHVEVIRQQQRIRRVTASALGLTVAGEACRFLLRIDDFPSPFARSQDLLRFHQVAMEYGLPYLLAVTPFFSLDGQRRSLSASDVDILHRCMSDGVELALHGFTHRSRYGNYASELAGLSVARLRAELERADAEMRAKRLETIGFVAPFNAYDPLTLGVLAERFALICGGPESVPALGYRAGPSFLLGSLYVPSYRRAYDISSTRLAQFDRTIAEADGLIIPVTLHWANHIRDGCSSFRALCERLRGRTERWGDLLDAVDHLKARTTINEVASEATS
jgi:peptidoglycan/xylan/chitin deacetylase (PgdA/CDA1 family)